MLKRTLLAISLAALGTAHAADIDALRATLSERMKGVQIGAISKLPYADVYEVVVNGHNIVYTDASGSVAWIGKLIDLKTRKDLAEQRKEDLLRVDFAALPLDKALVKVKGSGARKLAVFSDPECPYCQALEKELKLIDNVTIYTFLYPIAELHPGAAAKSHAIWCTEDRVKAWDELMLRGVEPKAKKAKGNEEGCAAPLKEIADVARSAFIAGTPGIVFGNGKLVPGMIDSRAIERHLAVSEKSAQP